MRLRETGGGTPGSVPVGGGLARAFRPSALLLVLLGAVAWSAPPRSAPQAATAAAVDVGQVRSVDRPAPGQSVPAAGPNIPFLSAAPVAASGVWSPASRRVETAHRTIEAGDRPGHRLRVERPPRPVV